jgi:hypothetical protein
LVKAGTVLRRAIALIISQIPKNSKLNRLQLKSDSIALLHSLSKILDSNAGIDPAAAKYKLHLLGWNRVALDYQSLQLALAWMEQKGYEGVSRFSCFSCVRCPIPHNQNQGPILLNINNFSKSYQHHVHNFIPD